MKATGAGEMAQQLKALAAEDLGSGLSTHMVAHNGLLVLFQRI